VHDNVAVVQVNAPGLEVTVYEETMLVEVGAVHDTMAELVEGVAVTVVGAPGGDENVQISVPTCPLLAVNKYFPPTTADWGASPIPGPPPSPKEPLEPGRTSERRFAPVIDPPEIHGSAPLTPSSATIITVSPY
jgi:hypothetical protein